MILRPRISEKSIGLAEARRTYIFDVPDDANKITVAKAVEEKFKVKVETVNIIISKGKEKSYKRITGRRRNIKKAYVRLAPDQSIKIFEGAN